MTIAIDKSGYDALWVANRTVSLSDILDGTDIIYQCPEQLGSGYERHVRLRGIDLLIKNHQFHRDLVVEHPVYENTDCVELGFCLANQQNFVQWTCEGDYLDAEICQFSAGDRFLSADIHLSHDLLQSFIPEQLDRFPLEFRQSIEGSRRKFYWEDDKLTPEMQLALRQMIHTPFVGMTERIYLESKCLELIALKLEQLKQIEPKCSKERKLNSEQIERIYQAQEILVCNINNSRSLLELSKQVGLNDCDLKRGFRQVFGTTVFGYLHNYRMMEAKRLIEVQHLNINEVARAVGYASRSTFSGAFKKKFGVSPNNYLG
jgi:AraC family transcriptional regulator, transcriptional activator of the genes for pyochelin and ferripyochelin receptors